MEKAELEHGAPREQAPGAKVDVVLESEGAELGSRFDASHISYRTKRLPVDDHLVPAQSDEIVLGNIDRVDHVMPALLEPERQPARQLRIDQELHAAKGRMRWTLESHAAKARQALTSSSSSSDNQQESPPASCSRPGIPGSYSRDSAARARWACRGRSLDQP